jgi:hypothetical protein
MKIFAAILFASLLMTGCFSTRSNHDSFVSLQSLVKQKLAATCDCGPICTNTEVPIGRFFEVTPRDSGCRIIVWEKEFFTRKVWNRQHSIITNLQEKFTMATVTMTLAARTNGAIDTNALKHLFAGMTNLPDLPDWSYERTGVDVDVQCSEAAYPGLERDSEVAQQYADEITSLLNPYQKIARRTTNNPPLSYQWYVGTNIMFETNADQKTTYAVVATNAPLQYQWYFGTNLPPMTNK